MAEAARYASLTPIMRVLNLGVVATADATAITRYIVAVNRPIACLGEPAFFYLILVHI